MMVATSTPYIYRIYNTHIMNQYQQNAAETLVLIQNSVTWVHSICWYIIQWNVTVNQKYITDYRNAVTFDIVLTSLFQPGFSILKLQPSISFSQLKKKIRNCWFVFGKFLFLRFQPQKNSHIFCGCDFFLRKKRNNFYQVNDFFFALSRLVFYMVYASLESIERSKPLICLLLIILI